MAIHRIPTGPWDPCFGYRADVNGNITAQGIANIGVTLLGGNPGSGKSTLSLQIAEGVAKHTDRPMLYIGAEEACEQIKERAMRMQISEHAMSKIGVIPIGSNADIVDEMEKMKPAAVFFDSLPGLVQDPEAAVELCSRLKTFAVTLKCPFVIIDHVTKDEEFAGLMKLQHAVDTTISLFYDKDDEEHTRTMTTVKNRFGPNVSLTFGMSERGLYLIEDNDDEDEDGDS